MAAFRVYFLFVLSLVATAGLKAAGWEEVKIGSQPYVTFESFCAFYQFEAVAVPEKEPFEIVGSYGRLQLTANSRDMVWNGRRIWLSFSFVRNEEGKGFVSKLDVIKLFDPLLRRGEMAPRRPLEGVIIDPGHGGTDNGSNSRAGYYEKNASLDTAKRLKTLLDAAGIPNKMTRTQDEYLLLEERASIANKNPGWIFVSLHYNSSTTRESHGVETYCLTPQYSSSTGDSGKPTAKDRIPEPGNAQDSLNLILADYVHQEIGKLHSKEGDRGLKRARFVVLRKVRIPGVLVEGGFLSNTVDSKLISTGGYRQKIAQSVASAIQNYSKLMNSPVEKAPLSLQPATPPTPANRTPEPVPTPTAMPTGIGPIPTPVEATRPAEKKQEQTSAPESEKKKPAPVSGLAPEALLGKPVVVPRPAEQDLGASKKEEPARPGTEAGSSEEKK